MRDSSDGSCGSSGVQRAERRLDAAARVSAFGTRPSRATRGRVAGAERHRLDEAHVPRPVERQCGERDDVVLVEAAHDDGVELDRREAGGLGGLDARPDLGERAPAHDARDALGIEAVEVDVEAPETRAAGAAGASCGQPHAVRREREVAQAGHRARAASTMSSRSARSVGSPPGQPDLPEADGDGGARPRARSRRR